MIRTLRAIAMLAMSALHAASLGAQPLLPALDDFARGIAGRVPPLAFAVVVVRGDSVVHLAGYGMRDRAREVPVTPETAFYIASSTKSFTALTAVLLAARGVVDLDAPIARYAPEFRLPAPLDPDRVTLRRLLAHRAGFESPTLSFRTAFTGDLPADSLFAVVGRDAIATDTAFTYTNTAYIIAARVLERVTGLRWQELIAREVLAPLRMTRTTAIPSQATGWELATGYGPGPDGFRPLEPKPDATMHAAGGMLMSASDAGRWLRAQLTEQPRALAHAIAATHRQHAWYSGRFDDIDRFGYGLGWQMGLVNGDTLLHHFGNYPGAFAHVSFMPSRDVGVAVFANSEMPAYAPVTGVIAQRAYDLVLGRTERDAWYGAYADSLASRVQRMVGIFRADHQRRAARPRVPPRGWAAYAGRYEGANMGPLTIATLGDTAAVLHFGSIRTRLEVLGGDTLRVEMPPGRGGAAMPVHVGADGRVMSLRLVGTDFVRAVPGARSGKRPR